MDTPREQGEEAYKQDVKEGVRKPDLEINAVKFLESLEDRVYRIRIEAVQSIPDGEGKYRLVRLLEQLETEAWKQERDRKQELDEILDEQYEAEKKRAESARRVA